MVLNFEEEHLIKELSERKPKKVLVQLPEGIKQNAFQIAKIFNMLGIETVFSGETCWGGCSIAVNEARDVQADLIVHFGHAEFLKVDFPVLYIEVRDELNLLPLLEKSLRYLKKANKIGLSYSIQHRHDLDNIINFYKENGKEVILSQKKGMVAYEGHIVGCQYRGLKAIEDKVDAFVIMGNNFHAMGAAMSVDKPVVLVDVYNNEIKDMRGVREKILKQRAISIGKFRDAKKVGIITEIKPGQKFGMPSMLIDKLKQAGKEVILISMNEMTPDKIMNFYYVDAFVEMACPRIAIDDFAKYPRTIITYKEALVALGEKSWDEIIKNGIV
jgi:2-(3-amino-3-carboxypropyl)histidine synthase